MFDVNFLLRVQLAIKSIWLGYLLHLLYLPLHTSSSDPEPNLLRTDGAAAERIAETSQDFDLPWELPTVDRLNSNRSLRR